MRFVLEIKCIYMLLNVIIVVFCMGTLQQGKVEGNKVTTLLNITSYSKSTNHAVVLRDNLEFSLLAG